MESTDQYTNERLGHLGIVAGVCQSTEIRGIVHFYAETYAISNVVVRRGTRPDIPDAVGKNLERYSWIVVLTWSGNTKGTRACTKRISALKVCRSR